MFENAIKIPSKINSKILLKVVPGHFATSHYSNTSTTTWI